MLQSLKLVVCWRIQPAKTRSNFSCAGRLAVKKRAPRLLQISRFHLFNLNPRRTKASLYYYVFGSKVPATLPMRAKGRSPSMEPLPQTLNNVLAHQSAIRKAFEIIMRFRAGARYSPDISANLSRCCPSERQAFAE